MAKNLNDAVTIDSSIAMDQISTLLDEGKAILLFAHKGSIVTESLEKGYSDYFAANIELVSEGNYQGLCGCGEPNNVKLHLWRD